MINIYFMNKANKKIIFIFLFFLFFIISAKISLAATLEVKTDKTNLDIDSIVKVSIILNTEGELLNAFSGTLDFPSDKIDLQEIKTGSSLVNLWIEEPKKIDNNTITFSGITPGGFYGSGTIFVASFKTIASGEVNFNIENAKNLINDGNGSEVITSIINKKIEIKDIPGKNDLIIIDLTDNTPPESFSPIITKLPEITGNDNYVIIFNTTDKQSGIDYYEIKEGNLSKKIITNPYILENQKLDKDIIITAVDKSGNKRIEKISLKKNNQKNNYYYYFIILAIIIVILFFAKKKKNAIYNKKN